MAQGDNIILDVFGNTKPLEKDIARVANQALNLNTKGFSQPLGKINGQLGEFEKSLAASNARVIAFGASAGAIFAVQKAFNETIKSVIEVEKALTDINVILNVSEKSLNQFGSSLFDIAKNTGLSFAEVAKSAVEFSRQGLSLQDTLKRTSDALILTRLSGLDTVSSVEALTAAINSFNSSALDSTQIVNKLAAVDAAFAVSSADLAEAIKRVGSSAVDAGVSFDQLIALVTSAQQITSRGGSVIGNSFKTIFTRLQRPKTLDTLEEIGVVTKDQEGNILPLIQILSQLAGQYENLSAVQRAQIAESVGGVFQINVLKASLGDLSKEYSIYSRALAVSGGATDEASRRNEALNETLSATVNKTLVNLQGAATDIGNLALAPALKKSLGGLNYVLENFGTKDAEDVGGRIGKGLATGIGNFLSGPGLLLGAASLIKIFERLTVFTADAFKQITGLNSQSAEQKTLQSQILSLIGRNPQIIEQINKGNLNTVALNQQILSLIEQETVAMQKQLAVANSLTQTLMASGVRVPAGGPMRGTAVKTKSLGFIPNFSANQEIMGALSGGYTPGKIKQTFIPNYGQVTYNSAETVKKFPGMSQQAIMPPSNSPAGQNYRQNFRASHGFDPYSSAGFVPNFAGKIGQQYNFRKLLKADYELLSGEEARIANLRKNEDLVRNGTIVRESGEIFIKKDKKNVITSQLRATEKSAAQARGQKEGGKIRSKSVFVYPDLEGGKSFQAGGTASDGTFYKFPVFPFPGGNKQIPDLLYDNVSRSLVDVAKDYISGITSRPNLVKSDLFESYVRSNLSRSAVEASTGQVFESAIKASINRATTSEIENMDLDGTEIKAIASRFKGAKGLSGFQDGDFKNSLSKGNLDSFADKLLYKDTRGKTRKFNGFIPNFSPINRAFKAEKSLGGSPALDFQPGVGLYVRDSKTQPNFASVKRDHPEGIDNAISNSFAVQKGIAALGFVPNFAPTSMTSGGLLNQQEAAGVAQVARNLANSIGTADLSFKKLAQNLNSSESQISQLTESTKKTKFNLDKFREKALYASFAVSLVGGFASELAGEDKILADNINGLTQGLGTATTAVGLIPGPMGLVAGGAVALYTATSFVAKAIRDNGEAISKNFEKAKEQNTQFTSSTQKYTDTLQKLNDAYSDNKTSIDTILKINNELQAAAQDIPSEYRLQLLSISNNTKLQEEINKIQAKRSRLEKTLLFANQANQRLSSGSFGYGDVFSGSGMSAASGAKDLLSNLENVDGFLKNLDVSFTNLSRPELLEYFKKFGLSNTDLLSVFTRMNQGDVEEFKNALYLVGKEMKASKEELEAIVPVRDRESKKLAQIQRESNRAKDALDNLKIGLDNLIDTAIRSESFKQNFAVSRQANLRDIQLNKADSLMGLYEQYSSPESVNTTKFNIDQLNRNENLFSQIRNTQEDARKSMFEDVRSFARDLAKPKDGENAISNKALNTFNDRILQISQEKMSPAQTQQALSDEIGTLGLSQDQSTEIQQKLAAISIEQNQKMATIAEESKKSNSIAKNNLDIQQRILQSRRDIETAGGVQGYLDPESFQKTQESFLKYRNMYRSNDITQSGRGATGLLSEIIKFSGGGVKPELLGNFGNLKREAIAGRSKDIRNQANYFARQVPGGAGGIYKDIAKRSDQIATTQIENLIKDQNIGQNVDEIKTILQAIGKQQAQAFSAGNLNDSISYAIQSVESSLIPSIDTLRVSVDMATKEYALRQERAAVAEEYGKNITQRAIAGEQFGSATQRINELRPVLEKGISQARSAPLVVPGTNLPASALLGIPGKAGVYEESKSKALQALQQGSPIDISKFAQRGYGSEDLQPLIDSIKSYNDQLEKRSNAERAFNDSDTTLQNINTKINNVDDQLRSAIPYDKRSGTMTDIANQTQRVVPQIAPTPSPTNMNNLGQQFLQNLFSAPGKSQNPFGGNQKVDVGGTVKIEKPENPLDLNVGGLISFDQPTFTIKIDPDSDLTSAVTPVVQEFLDKTQNALNNKFDNDIQKLREDMVKLGGQRSAPTF